MPEVGPWLFIQPLYDERHTDDLFALSMRSAEIRCTPMQVTLKVAMACSGCEGAVRKVLQNKPGTLKLKTNAQHSSGRALIAS